MNLIFEDLEKYENFKSCPDINTSGIARFGRSPLLNASHLYASSNGKPLPFDYYYVNDDIKDYIISASVNHSPDDWTGYNPKVKSVFSYLNEKYITDLRNGKAMLLLDSSFEGYQTNWLWDWFHSECKEWGVSPKYIVYVTGNMVADEGYDKWANDNQIKERIKVIPYPHFELDMGMSCYHREKSENPLPTFQDHIKYKTENLNDIKTYACLNKRIRFQRIWFYRYLYESGLLNKGLVSMNEFEKGPYFWEGETIDEDVMENMQKNLPLIVHGKPNNEFDDSFYINRFNDQISLDTFMTVISEAHCADSDQTMFLSEKTFKVIACRNPFMIMGNKDSMRKMREIGYRTFDGFIDEGYDGLPTHERLQYIIESIRKVDNIKDKLEWFKSMEDIIEHNYSNFINKLFRVPDAFAELKKYYNKTFNNKFI